MEDNFAVLINDIMTGKKSLSYSALSKFLKSPRHFKDYKTGDKEVTKAMEEGKMFHMACLEPDKFEQAYWVLDDTDKCNDIGGAKPRSTKVYKEWVAEQDAKNEGRTRIDKKLYDTFLNMSQALRLNSSTKKLMSELVNKEEGIEFEHDEFNIRGFIDGVGSDYLVDIKKVADAQFKRVKWDIKDMNYDMQAGMYCNAKKGCSNYYLIYIDASCHITVVKLTKETIEGGFSKFETALEDFRMCAEQDLWNSSYEFYNGGLINF